MFISKIKEYLVLEDYNVHSIYHISVIKGEYVYSIGMDLESNMVFVTTEPSLPFGRNSKSGYIPWDILQKTNGNY